MTNIKLLNNVDHAHLRIRTGYSAAFGDDLNQMPLFVSEFEQAQREYPILFRRDGDDDWRAVVITGFDARENLYLREDQWQARYVPAIQRRGPLSIGLREAMTGADPEPVIHIDLDHPRLAHDTGEALFLPQGGNGPWLEGMTKSLRLIHEGVATTRAFITALDQAQLLMPITLEVEVTEDLRYSISNMVTLDRQKLASLDATTLHRLNGRGYIALAVLAAASLGNVARLADLKRDRIAAA